MNYLNFKEMPKKGYGWIYKYTSPSGKSYIGQTTYSLYDRAKKDGKGYDNCTIFYRAIQKYGLENFEVEILDQVPKEQLEDVEAEYIEKLGTLRPQGYNTCSRSNKKSVEKITTAIDVYDLELNYIESFNSLIEAAREYDIPYQSISDCINHKIEHYKDKVYVKKGEKPQIPKVVKTHGRQTAQYDLEGNLVAIYQSANEAARAIGKNTAAGRNIRSVCAGQRQMAYGFKWAYLD